MSLSKYNLDCNCIVTKVKGYLFKLHQNTSVTEQLKITH